MRRNKSSRMNNLMAKFWSRLDAFFLCVFFCVNSPTFLLLLDRCKEESQFNFILEAKAEKSFFFLVSSLSRGGILSQHHRIMQYQLFPRSIYVKWKTCTLKPKKGYSLIYFIKLIGLRLKENISMNLIYDNNGVFGIKNN